MTKYHLIVSSPLYPTSYEIELSEMKQLPYDTLWRH